MTEKTAISNAKDTWKNNGRFDVSVKMKEYKCFRDEYVGFDRIMPINVIIGRNNSGKSALLDMIQAICSRAPSASEAPTVFQLAHSLRLPFDAASTFEYIGEINEEYSIRLKYKSPNTSFPTTNDQHCAEERTFKLLKDHKCRVRFQTNQNENLAINIQGKLPNDHYTSSCDITIKTKANPFVSEIFREVIFRRVRAERDIVPEPKSNSDETIAEDGRGATNVINLFCNNENHNEFIIREDLLDALNIIFEPDNAFEEIRVVSTQAQEGKGELWEVVLYESEKNRVNLSQSGSGLKTVLLVLLNLLVVPEIPLKGQGQALPLKTFVFAFEELENNLHPSLLRRLYKYIEDFVIANRCYVFITTHSNVVIDFFSRSPYAQLVHVTHDGKQASAKTIETFTEKSGIFDDLGVRASDLLQANGIVWLEGPSDRIYFNKWVEVFSNGQLKEHRHYECAFYGGSLLSHHGTDATDDVDADFINILKINRNCILIADSDRTSPRTKLKTRLQNFIDKADSIIPEENLWITNAKEIENYIPVESLRKIFCKQDLQPIGQHELFYSDKKECYWSQSPIKTFDKVDFAAKVIATYPSDIAETKKWLDLHDLLKKMNQICSIITAWNLETRGG